MLGEVAELNVLAANIRSLSKTVDEMRTENRDWRDRQLEIYKSLASNQSAMANLSRRVSAAEDEVRSLVAWKWKSVGILTGFILVIQWITGR